MAPLRNSMIINKLRSFRKRRKTLGYRNFRTTNLGVGSSNLSGRAKYFNGLCPPHRSNHKIKTVFRTVNFFVPLLWIELQLSGARFSAISSDTLRP